MFSVEVRRKSAFVTAFVRPSKAYIVNAVTAQRAKNIVKRHLKGQRDVEVLEAIPAQQIMELMVEERIVRYFTD
jgi:(2Fe-2S) ferredoxin